MHQVRKSPRVISFVKSVTVFAILIIISSALMGQVPYTGNNFVSIPAKSSAEQVVQIASTVTHHPVNGHGSKWN